MNIVKQVLSFILLFALLAGAGWLLYELAILIFSINLDPNILAGLIGAGSLLLASVVSIILQKNREQRINIQIEHRNKFGPIYQEFIDNVFNKVLFAEKLYEEPLSDDELLKVMADFTQNIIVWGSDDVIKAYSNFRKVSALDTDKIKKNTVFAVEELLLAMRKDLGHPNKGLKKGQLLGVFVNDIDKYLK